MGIDLTSSLVPKKQGIDLSGALVPKTDLSGQNAKIDQMQPQKEGFFSSLLSASGESLPGTLRRGLFMGLDPVNDYESIKKIAQSIQNQPAEVKADLEHLTKPGIMDKVNAGLNLIEKTSPLPSTQGFRQNIAKAGQQAGSGDIPGAVGTIIPTVAPIAAPATVEKGLGVQSEPIGSIGEGASDALRASAAKNLEQVLGATRQKLKAAATEHVVPGMMERGMTGMSRDSLLNQANQIVADNGPKVGAGVDAATKSGVEFPTQPLIDRLESIREQHQVRDAEGNVTATRPAAMNMIESLKGTLEKYGGSINPSELQALRHFWDEDVANSTKGFLLDQPAEGLQVKRATTNALRGTLNDNLPDVAAANKEYSFGKDLQSVLEATQQQTASQSGILGKVLKRGQGAAVGGTIGGVIGGPPGAAVGGALGTGIATLMDTTAWKTVSSALKVKIADALSSGDYEGARAAAPAEVKETIPPDADTAKAHQMLRKIASGNASPDEINTFFAETGIQRSDLARAGIKYAPKQKTGTNE